MLQAYDGYIVVLGIRIFLILGMHMYVLVGNVQCGICAAQIIRFLDAVGFRFYIELAQAHVFAVKREGEREREQMESESIIIYIHIFIGSTYSPRRSRTPSPCTQ